MTSTAKVPVAVPARKLEKRLRPRMTLRYQLRALTPVFVFGILLLVLTGAFVWWPAHQRAAADPNLIIRAILGAQLFRIEVWLVPVLLLCACLAAVAALLRARRIAVSMARLQECLTKLAVTDPEPPAFAPGDDFYQLEVPFSGVTKRIEQLTRGNLEMLRFLRHNLEGIAQRASAPDHSDVELHQSIRVLIRDVDMEIKKLQMKS